MKGWAASSMVFPWITRFVWGDIDLKWFPEANLSHPRHKGFYTVRDYIEREPMEGSHIQGILAWRRDLLNNRKTNLLSPLDAADSLEWFSHIAFTSLQKLPKPGHHNPNELHQTLSDIQGFALIGKYYAEKIRAACDLALLDTTNDEKYRKSSIHHLELAKKYWNDYAFIYSIKNKPALYNRVGFVDVNRLKQNVQHDIDIVTGWKPGKDKLNMNQGTEVPFRN